MLAAYLITFLLFEYCLYIYSFIYSFNATLDHTTASHDIPNLEMYHGHSYVVSQKRVDKPVRAPIVDIQLVEG